MATVYVYSDKTSLVPELVALGRRLGTEVLALAFDGQQASDCANCGAGGIVLLEGDTQIPENNARATAAWLRQAGEMLLLVGATPIGRDFASRVAGYLDCGLVSDISGAETVGTAQTGVRTQRIQYGGAVLQEETLTLPAVITVPAGRNEPATGAVDVVEKKAIEADTRLRYVKAEPIAREGVDLALAKSVIGVGMGVAAQEDLGLIEKLAAALDAGIGCTRGIAEERHWIPAEQYLGLSGISVSPDLYIAVGISGQVQHLVGVRDSKMIVAINKNVDAPIFRAADYGIVGDLYEVVPALIKELE
jgi:electron transfer flavoprotein alpha subunit